MDKAQALTLTRLVKGMCPAQQVDRYTPDAWYEAGLKDMEYEDAKAAVMALGTKIRFIALSDISDEVKLIRRARFNGVRPDILGAAADPDDVVGYLDAVKSDVKAIGDGVPLEVIEAGEHRPVDAVLQSLVRRRAIEGAS